MFLWKLVSAASLYFFVLVILSGFVISQHFLSKGNSVAGNVVIGFTGDVMLGRLVNKKISATNYVYPWGDMLETLKQHEVNIINLETTLTQHVKKIPKVFNFRADPDKIESLTEASIDLVCLANNHIRDFGDEGLIETIEVLDKAKIKHVGAGLTLQDARRPVVIEKNGIKIGVIGWTDNESGWKAGENKPGSNYIEVGDIASIKECIKEVREKVDILIVTMHWGPNNRPRPTQDFQAFAHDMIDAGIDILHGHSAHIFQGVEVYKGKLIMYDTGDFVDDYMVGPIKRNDQSFLFSVEVSKQGVQGLKLTPVLISNMQVNKAQGNDLKQTIERMKKLSAEFGTKFSEENSKLVLRVKE